MRHRQDDLLDPAAFTALYDDSARELARWLTVRVGPDVAQELLAETFAVAWCVRRRYRAKLGPAQAWLFGIARNLTADYFRRLAVEDRARRRLGIDLAATPALAEDHDARLDAGALKQRLRAALDQLPARTRHAVSLRVVGELDYEELATKLGCSNQAARLRVSARVACATQRRCARRARRSGGMSRDIDLAAVRAALVPAFERAHRREQQLRRSCHMGLGLLAALGVAGEHRAGLGARRAGDAARGQRRVDVCERRRHPCLEQRRCRRLAVGPSTERMNSKTPSTAATAAGVALLALSGCGGSNLPGNAVARVGDSAITRDSYAHWLQIFATQAKAQTAPAATTQAAVQVPKPPAFAACIRPGAPRRRNRPRASRNRPTPSSRPSARPSTTVCETRPWAS